MVIIHMHLLKMGMEVFWHVGENALPFEAFILFFFLMQNVGSRVGDLKGIF